MSRAIHWSRFAMQALRLRVNWTRSGLGATHISDAISVYDAPLSRFWEMAHCIVNEIVHSSLGS